MSVSRSRHVECSRCEYALAAIRTQLPDLPEELAAARDRLANVLAEIEDLALRRHVLEQELAKVTDRQRTALREARDLRTRLTAFAEVIFGRDSAVMKLFEPRPEHHLRQTQRRTKRKKTG